VPPTRISQKPTVAVAVAQKVAAGHTEVSQKTGTSATPVMQKAATGYTEVAQK
jgi:hypothetical protein